MSKTGEPLVLMNGVCYAYASEMVLCNVHLQINKGDFLAVIGPNGGGKTTLVKLILGLLTPTRGTVLVGGRPPGEKNGFVGYVPQQTDQNQSFPATVLEVVCMGLFDPRKRSFFPRHRENNRLAMAVLEQLALADLAGRRIGDLSGGQLQRVLIARALVSEPELLIFDEPTASLDTRAQTEFFELLSKLNADRTILVVTHDLLAIASYARSVACVNHTVHSHARVGSAGELVDAFYSAARDNPICPVEQFRRLPVQKEIHPHV
ncbi:ABC transporter ATP-binding protein [Desulforhopalus vacuolatus]|uniref:metal ABC transporter ATP-binding protein n=1 Tax=Desulforhopalus vacuolatus TaxID=40414 RepID=UPI001965C78F|nr:ABC transporter ATP-binding protein [Desulforhopalus vacuolatus]MBM9519154.1 ABC transporter ATP-binding protein [Desulforhopalus vacuolatus]